MRLLVVLLVLTVSIGFAAPVLAPPSPLCTAVPGTLGKSTDVIIPFAVWSAPGFNCMAEDKIYSNFSTVGVDNATLLEIQAQQIGSVDLHTATFSGNFLSSFSVSYDIAIDLTQSPSDVITRVSADISNPANLGAPNNIKSVFTEGASLIGTITSTPGVPGTPLVTFNTALHVLDNYSANGGAAVAISNTFAEQSVPEPAIPFLIGGGLVGLSLYRRYRKSQC